MQLIAQGKKKKQQVSKIEIKEANWKSATVGFHYYYFFIIISS